MDVQPLETILVPVNFTQPSLNALTVAVRLAQHHQAHVQLIYVRESFTSQPDGHNEQGPDLTPEQADEEGSSRIQQLAAQTEQEHQIHCSGQYGTGKTPVEVAATASRVNADLIVIGTQNGADTETFRLNSEAYQLIKIASCPVLTVPVHQKWTTFERILFPVRPIQGALDKYEFARKLIRQYNAELTVLALCAPDEVISIHQVQDEITALTGKLAEDEVRSQTLFCQTDSIAETVLEKADELRADLLIITASLSITTDNFFMGPFTQQIVFNARVPVLAIKPEAGNAQKTARISWQQGQTD